jgi:CheY-like chemotaxis protein
MALRILLADESLNVKKNLQIALQDYGVDVRTVLTGDEVITNIKLFKPEIIFLDILLAKISGYDLCAQIKNNPDFRHLPVILVWSNFMHIDEAKAKQCRSDGNLEKPFDKDSIRKLIQHFVPKTVNQTLNEFLKMPPLLSSEANFDSAYARASSLFEDKEENDEFISKPTSSAFTKSIPEISPLTSSQDEPEDWSQKNIITTPKPAAIHTKQNTVNPAINSINTPPVVDEEFDVEIANVQMQNDAIPDEDLIEGAISGSKKARRHPMMKDKGVSIAPLTLDEKHLEEIIRIQIHENIQHWIKKYMPEVAERLIKNELERLSKDLENDAT